MLGFQLCTALWGKITMELSFYHGLKGRHVLILTDIYLFFGKRVNTDVTKVMEKRGLKEK